MSKNVTSVLFVLACGAAGYGAFRMQQEGLDNQNFAFFTLVAIMATFYVEALRTIAKMIGSAAGSIRMPSGSGGGTAAGAVFPSVLFAAVSFGLALLAQQAILNTWFPYDAAEGWTKAVFMVLQLLMFILVVGIPLIGAYILGDSISEAGGGVLGVILGIAYVIGVGYVLVKIGASGNEEQFKYW